MEFDKKTSKSIVFFDGVCNLCHTSVQFIILRDKKAIFHFAALQSDFAEGFLRGKKADMDLKTVLVFHNGKIYQRSDAALVILNQLPGYKLLANLGWIVPRPIRNFIYNWVAHHRYQWFGKKEACLIPKPEWSGRFLD